MAEIDQHVYTRQEVERLLWEHLARRPQLTTHGRIVASYGRGPYICPRCHGDDDRRRRCALCDGTGRVADVLPVGSGTVSVSDALLSRADLLRAIRQLPHRLRVLLLHYYALGASADRIGKLLAPHNGGRPVSRRTVFRWRSEAVGLLVAILNRTYARQRC